MTVIITQLQAIKGVPYSNTRADTCKTEQRTPPCIIVVVVRRRKKERVVLYPHALRGPASAGVLSRRGECCYGDRFHL